MGYYWASLPQAGTRRELRRMYQTAAAGNLRAKTGTIEGVSALSGIVRSRDEERLAFSILLNGTPSTTRAKRVENLVGARLGPNSCAVPNVDLMPELRKSTKNSTIGSESPTVSDSLR
ncbi:MAG: hypothetical protein CM1200mP14_02350 [Gammaproteobacteria bacterium]|nr:MAG: hypothetical protein CM1200mP14_02350 [Gammaproteobacteria bacterium]